MTTQTLELQAVTDEELMAAAGGGPHFTSKNSVNDDHGLQSLGLMERLRQVGPGVRPRR